MMWWRFLPGQVLFPSSSGGVWVASTTIVILIPVTIMGPVILMLMTSVIIWVACPVAAVAWIHTGIRILLQFINVNIMSNMRKASTKPPDLQAPCQQSCDNIITRQHRVAMSASDGTLTIPSANNLEYSNAINVWYGGLPQRLKVPAMQHNQNQNLVRMIQDHQTYHFLGTHSTRAHHTGGSLLTQKSYLSTSTYLLFCSFNLHRRKLGSQ